MQKNQAKTEQKAGTVSTESTKPHPIIMLVKERCVQSKNPLNSLDM